MKTVDFEASPRLKGKACAASGLAYAILWSPIEYLLGGGYGRIAVTWVISAVLCGIGLYCYLRRTPFIYKVSLESWADRAYAKGRAAYLAKSIILGLLVYLAVTVALTLVSGSLTWDTWKNSLLGTDITILLVFYIAANSFLTYSEYYKQRRQ